jgi:hypothetical protein
MTTTPQAGPVSAGPVRYLSRKQVAEYLGVQPDTLGRYRLPGPDAWIGDVRGWLPETIVRWNAARAGRVRSRTR